MRTIIGYFQVAVVVAAIASVIGSAMTTEAAEFFLRAEATTLTMPDGVQVPMWGFALDSGFGYLDGEVTIPGPRLIVDSNDTTLIIHLDNNLPEAISLIIPGQFGGNLTPVRAADGRIHSFAPVTEPANSAPGTYTWTDFRPGAFLYQSGTHAAVQVQMGLYGAITKDYATGQAYDAPASAYDQDVVLVFSEIDPIQHEAIASGMFGDNQEITSTVDYLPSYFLINGQPYKPQLAPIPIGMPGDSVLLRFFNAGLKNRAPTIPNRRIMLYAEDGNLLPYPKDRHFLFLPAGQTQDVKLELTEPGYIPIYDRAMGITNQGEYPGGMMAYLEVAGPVQRTLHAQVTGSGQGRIIAASMPGGLDCSTSCDAIYNDGTALLLKALPNPGSFFTGWTGVSCPDTPSCTVDLTSDLTVSAQFELVTINIGAFFNGAWNLDLNHDGTWNPFQDGSVSFGGSGDYAVTGDWTGDGYEKVAVFKAGTWKLDLNGDGLWSGPPNDKTVTFGALGDTPVVGDWNGDGIADVGVYKAGMWRIDRNGNGVWDGANLDALYTFGKTGSKPIVGDWNADGRDKIGSYLNGVWSLDRNGNGIWEGAQIDQSITFGQTGAMPVAGDWNSDGITGIGFFVNGRWFIDANENGLWDGIPIDRSYTFGSQKSIPITGNWPTAYAKSERMLPGDQKPTVPGAKFFGSAR